MKQKSIPHAVTARKDNKGVKVTPQPADSKPVWRFSTTDKQGPFAWPAGTTTELEIVGKLHAFDSMSWKGPGSIEGKQHHYLSPDSISASAKKRLNELRLEDEIDHLFSFHMHGKPRIIAIRHGNIAKLLWYDPEHQVAPSTKNS